MGTVPQRPKPNFIQRILARFSYSQKFQVIACLVGFVTILILYLLISNLLREINIAEFEIKGNQYQQSIHQIIGNITKHRIISNRYLGGNKDLKGELAEIQGLVDGSFNHFNTLNSHSEDNLKTSSNDMALHEKNNITPAQIYAQWKDLVNSFNRTTVEENNVKHLNIINNFQELLQYISDTSNMTYDREVETHYLMESALRFLPEEQDLIATIVVYSENIIKRGTISQAEKFQLSTLVSLLLSNTTITEQSINKSIIEETKFNKRLGVKTSLSEPLKSYKQSILDFTGFLEKTLFSLPSTPRASVDNEETTTGAAMPQLPPNALTELNFLGIASLSKNNQLWDLMSEQVDLLLNLRVSEIRIKGYGIIGFVIFVLGAAIFIGYLVISETNYFFREVHKAVNNFAQGDLSARAPIAYDKAFDRMRRVLNELGDSIEDLVEQLHKSGVQLTTTTTQISAAAKHQEGTVCQQEATVKQILVTAGEISSTARDFAKTMNEVSRSAEETSGLASSGKEDLTQMEESMHQMVKASKNIASKLAVLNEKAGAITSVITTITKVADQTNLLSLNAAIEAEKAGEHGKSFAVIAREIRRLADQTANALLDIEKMITEMMAAVSEGVMGVDKFSIEIRTGADQVSTVSEQLSQIIERVQKQTVSYENVNKGVQAQSLGAEQINESIMQLSDAAQETTNSIRQFHAAIEQLNISTKQMQVSVSRLKNGAVVPSR